MDSPQSPRSFRESADYIATFSEQELRDKLHRLFTAIDPEATCICSDFSKIQQGEEQVCAYHSTRVGWIIHTARQVF